MSKTQRTTLRRKPSRGSHERRTIEAILDEALVSHLGVVEKDGFPVVTPTLHVRVGSDVYVHGSAASRTLGAAAISDVCLTATLIDGLVLARAAMHHSANYRSVMVFGCASEVQDTEEKTAALEALVEKFVPGRWTDARKPSQKELRATSVLRVGLTEASAKVRNGPPLDDETDLELPIWAGVVGLRLTAEEPQASPPLPPGVECPEYITKLIAAHNEASAGRAVRGQLGKPG